MPKLKIVAVAALATCLAGPALAQEGDAAAGEQVFRKCQACHAVGENATNKVGPQLNDLFGRQPGAMPDYSYSKAMKEFGEGKVWNAELLADYLHAPRNVVKGTKMAFPGLRKDEEVADVIAYLAQYDEGGMDPAK